MNNNQKSATVAGLLGIFLGSVGAHNWYLGEKKKGIIHLCLLGGAILLLVVADVILPMMMTTRAVLSTAGLVLLLNGIALMISSGNSLWGFIEGIIILVKGDAGLAQRGIVVGGASMAQATMPRQNEQNAVGHMPMQNNMRDGEVNNVQNENAGIGHEVINSAENATMRPSVPVKTQKQPMDPAVEKKIILGAIIGGATVVVGVIAIVVISLLTRVDYGETYRVAKELSPEITAFAQNTSCTRVLDYVDSQYTTVTTYNDYVSSCLSAGSEIDGLIEKLGATSGVKRNKEIKEVFDKFSEGVSQTLPNAEELEEKLAMYRAWHEYVYLEDDVRFSDTNAELQAVAAPLIDSGNEVLKTYGEGWLTSVLAVATAYREYDGLSYSDSNKTTARQKYQELQASHKTWMAENKPNIKTMAALNFENTSKLYDAWTKLYDLIRETYEENYDEESGDCVMLFGEVFCE